MSNTNTGGPAFPSSEWDAEYERTFHTGGMHLRDYFAAKAMQAILSNPEYKEPDDILASHSYFVADAMLKAREV